MIITKSDYLSFKQCKKSFWFRKNDKDLMKSMKSDEVSIDKLDEIKELARKLFTGGKYVQGDSLKQKIEKTKTLINKGIPIIYEGTFSLENLLINCDILVNEGEAWNLYSVSTSTSTKMYKLDELAFQLYGLGKFGLKINSVNTIAINKKYLRNGPLDTKSLFTINNVTEEVNRSLNEVENAIKNMKDIKELPSYDKEIGLHCEKYDKEIFPCKFKNHCWDHIPENSVFDIAKIGKKKFELYERGIISIDDIPDDYKLTEAQQIQVDCHKENKNILKKEQISDYVKEFKYPLYFIDFETFQQPIPMYDGVKPYQQIPFQYSLHIMKDGTSPLEHIEFLAKEGEDPRRALAESIVNNIPTNVCSIAYNMGFEKMVLKSLAHEFPDLSDHLLNIVECMKDLMVPFQKKWIYMNEMQGSYSIKHVLPALIPNNPELDYRKLQIQNGSMAMDAFSRLHEKESKEIEQCRKDLLAYCKLDTLAMVRIWEEINKLLN